MDKKLVVGKVDALVYLQVVAMGYRLGIESVDLMDEKLVDAKVDALVYIQVVVMDSLWAEEKAEQRVLQQVVY